MSLHKKVNMLTESTKLFEIIRQKTCMYVEYVKFIET